MADFPALPLWTDAYLSDTRDLSLEEHGAYVLLLMIAWRRPTCSLPDDMGWIRGNLPPVHGHTFKAKVVPILERFFERSEGGEWVQKRLSREREFLDTRSRQGRKGALARWANRYQKESDLGFKPISNGVQTDFKPSASGLQYSMISTPVTQKGHITPHPHPHTVRPRAKALSIISAEIEAQFVSFWSAYPRKVGKGHARRAFAAALAKTKCQTILDAIAKQAPAWTDPKFIPHPATWLNGERWEDQPTILANGNAIKPGWKLVKGRGLLDENDRPILPDGRLDMSRIAR